MTQTVLNRFMAKVDMPLDPNGCWPWKANSRGGYGLFSLDGRPQSAHRTAYRLMVGEIPNGLDVLHRCDTPRCVNVRHLFLGTQADNAKDMCGKNRQAKGDQVYGSILTASQVLEIRASFPELSMEALAAKFKTSKQTIWRTIKRKTWKHL
jgi:hypothetical protein